MAEPRPRPPAPGGAPRPRPPAGRRPTGRPETRAPSAPAPPSTASAAPAERRGWRAIPAPVRWIGGILGLIVLAVAIFAMLFQWNWLRGPVSRYASAHLHRQVEIHGDLSGHVWTWTPSLSARNVTVA